MNSENSSFQKLVQLLTLLILCISLDCGRVALGLYAWNSILSPLYSFPKLSVAHYVATGFAFVVVFKGLPKPTPDRELSELWKDYFRKVAFVLFMWACVEFAVRVLM